MMEFRFISNTILNLKAPHVLLWLKRFSLISTLSFQFQHVVQLQFKINFVIKKFFYDFEICLESFGSTKIFKPTLLKNLL